MHRPKIRVCSFHIFRTSFSPLQRGRGVKTPLDRLAGPGPRVGSIPTSDESSYKGSGVKQSRLRTVLTVVGATKMRQVKGSVLLMESSIVTCNPFGSTHCQHMAPLSLGIKMIQCDSYMTFSYPGVTNSE